MEWTFLFSIILNFANAWLVYTLVFRVQKRRTIAAMAGMLFLLHPFLWRGLGIGISQQKGLFLFFFLLAFIFFENLVFPKKINYFNSLTCFLIAVLFSREAFVLPFFLLLYDYHFLAQESLGWPKVWKKYYPFFEALGLFLAFQYIFSASSLVPASEPRDLLTGVANIPAIVLYCLSVSPNLIPQISGASGISMLKYLISAGGVALFILFSIKLYRFSRELSFISLWFFLSLVSAIYLTVLPGEPPIYYLPLLAISWFLGWLLSELRSARYGSMKYLGFLSLLCIMTFYLYKDIAYRGSDVMPKPDSHQFTSPDLADYHYFLAHAYEQDGNYTQALKENNLALKLNPLAIHPHLGLGIVYNKLGEYERSMQELQEVLKVFPYHPYALNWLADAYKKLGRWEEAKQLYRKTITYDPDDIVARNNLGALALREGKPQEAKLHFRHVLKIDPHDGVAREYLRAMR